jgi:hypothetical protein
VVISLRAAAPGALLGAALLLGAGPAAAQAQAGAQSVVVSGQRDLSSWLRAESPHFVVYTDTSGADVTRLLTQLERLDALLRLYTAPFARTSGELPAPKFTLYYLNRNMAFARFAAGAPEQAIGLVNSCVAGIVGVGVRVQEIAELTDAQLAREPLDEGQSYLFEAYARHFLYRASEVRAPSALIEGMAKYFSAVRFSNTQMVVGRTPTGVGRYLGLLDQGHRYELDYADVFARTYADAPTDAPAGARARATALEFEARAWTLAHYMLSTDERRRRLPRFLDAVHQGKPAAQAFQQSYGIALDQVGDAMWRYRLQAKVLRVQLPPAPALAIRVKPLSHAAGEFVLADAVRATCPGELAGQALLRSVRAQAAQTPNSDAARASLARAEIEWGDARAALPYVEEAAARDPDDADAAYWLGRANLRLAARDPARLPAARASLARAGALRPGAPEIALARLQAGLLAAPQPDPQTLAAVTAAWRLGRDSNPLARETALAEAWSGHPDAVLHVLRVLANDSRDPDSQTWAAAWQARLAHGVAPAELFAEMRGSAGMQASVKEWTVDQDSVAQEVERNAGIEAAQKTIDWQSTQTGPQTVPQASQAGAPQR